MSSQQSPSTKTLDLGDNIQVMHRGEIVKIPRDNYNALARRGHLKWMGYTLPPLVDNDPYITRIADELETDRVTVERFLGEKGESEWNR